jgi:hypothetical protein
LEYFHVEKRFYYCNILKEYGEDMNGCELIFGEDNISNGDLQEKV